MPGPGGPGGAGGSREDGRPGGLSRGGAGRGGGGEGWASRRDAATGLPGRVGLPCSRARRGSGSGGGPGARARELNGRLTDGEAIVVVSVGEGRKEVLPTCRQA